MTVVPVHVIGVGSPFGDDRLGWIAAETLANRMDSEIARGDVVVSTHDRPGGGIIAELENARAVILLDAVRSGAPPGTLHAFNGHTLAASGSAVSTHQIGVVVALQLGRALKQLPSATVVLGLEADPAQQDQALSDAVQRQMNRLIDAACEQVRQWLHDRAGERSRDARACID